MLAALGIVLAGAGSLWLWATWAVVDDTISARGQVVAAAPHHVLSHPVGGEVLEILVREGDEVRSGDILLRFGPAAAHAERADLQGRQLAVAATLARLQAERQGCAEIAFPDELRRAAAGSAAIDAETVLFAATRRGRAAKVAIIERRIEEYRIEISGVRDAQEGVLKELTLLDRRIGQTRDVLGDAEVERPTPPTHETAKARLEGVIGRMSAEVARVQQRIADAQLEILRVHDAWRERLASEIEAARRTAAAIAGRSRALNTVARRQSLAAPWDGLVTTLRYRRVGVHVVPNHPILDLRPTDAAIMVVASFSRWDAEALVDGARASVHLDASGGPIAFPPLRGTVRIQAAARTRTGVDAPRAIVELAVPGLSPRQRAAITAGLEAVVSVAAPGRSALWSMLSPLAARLDRWLVIDRRG